jgi:hypothetical protein
MFREKVPISTTFKSVDDPSTPDINEGTVFLSSTLDDRVVVSYQDSDCDADLDGETGENNFLDIDGDGIENVDRDFDAVTDDNCFDRTLGTDVYNPLQENDAFGQMVTAFVIDPADPLGALIPTEVEVAVGEYDDRNGNMIFEPIEDAVGIDPVDPGACTTCLNGLLDPGEDVGADGLSDTEEEALAIATCPEFLVGTCSNDTAIECRPANVADDCEDPGATCDSPVDRRSEIGPDCQPGVAILSGDPRDDDGNGIPNDPIEIGWCGSDDRDGDNFDPVTCSFETEGDGFLQGDIPFSPDPVGDACDNCPLFSNANQIDVDDDGVGDACENNDLDGDGVEDSADNCPTVPNPGQENVENTDNPLGDACDSSPPKDLDNDDRIDVVDNCTLVKNGDCLDASGELDVAACDQDGDGFLDDGDGIENRCGGVAEGDLCSSVGTSDPPCDTGILRCSGVGPICVDDNDCPGGGNTCDPEVWSGKPRVRGGIPA